MAAKYYNNDKKYNKFIIKSDMMYNELGKKIKKD
jgi:hypothetical protein